MAENEFVIDTAIDTKTLEKGVKESEKELDRLGKKYESIKAKQQKFLELGGSKQTLSKEYKEAAAETERLGTSLERLLNRKEKLDTIGASTSTQSYKALELEIDQVSEKFYKAEKAQEALEDSKYVPTKQWEQMEYDINNVTQAMDESRAKLADYKSRLEEFKNVSPLERIRNAFHSLGESARNAGKKASESFEKIKKSSKGGFTSLLKYAFGIRSLYVLFNKLRNALVDGFKNLAQFNNGVNPVNTSISNLKSSLTNLKNSFASAFAPILTTVEPILTMLIDKISQVVTSIGKLFAALTGAKTFTKAVKVQENYAASLDKTADSAKKAKKQLYSFDELETVNKEDTSGGGSGGGVSPNQMFQTEEIEGSIQRLADKIKGLFSDIDFGPLQKSFALLKQSLQPLVDLLLDGLAWAWKNVLKPFAKWTIEKALPRVITIFAHALDLVVAVLKALQPLGKWLFDVFLKPLAHMVGGVVISMLDYLDGLLVFLTGVFTLDQEKMLEGLKQMWTAMKDRVLAIANGIKDIMDNLDKWLQRVFAVDWNKWIGVLLSPLPGLLYSFKEIWNGIKQTLDGVITFINGVFAGNWKQAWEGIKQIFAGIWNTLGAVAKAPINVLIGSLNGLLQAVVAGVNAMFGAINKLSIKVPNWIPEIGGKKLGFNLSQVSAPRIPYLATGTVVPPSAKQFMAVLGDNNRETEVVSPLSTMKQAMSEVLAEYGGQGSGDIYISAEGDLDALVRLLNLKIDNEKSRVGKNFEKVVTA